MENVIKSLKKIFYRTLNYDIKCNELYQMQKENKIDYLIDVRSKQEYEESHISGSINIPLDEINSVEKLISLKNKVIVVYCKSGSRSRKAQKKLQKIGFLNVYNLIGGIENCDNII